MKVNLLESSSDVCPVCRTDRYLNPTMRLLLSPCYHNLCESCIERIFISGPAPCPQCSKILKKSQFVAQTFESLEVEKEVHIRQRIGKIFNKKLQDFDYDLEKYNDYLEESEELIYNLVHGVDLEQTNRRMETYKEENRQLIAANIQRQIAEEKLLQSRINAEAEEKLAKKSAYVAALAEEKRLKEEEKRKLLHQLETAPSQEAKTLILASLKRMHAMQISLSGERATVNISSLKEVTPAMTHRDEAERLALLQKAKREAAEAQTLANESHFDPFDHLYLDFNYKLDQNVVDEEFLRAKDDPKLFAGGFKPELLLDRAIWTSYVSFSTVA